VTLSWKAFTIVSSLSSLPNHSTLDSLCLGQKLRIDGVEHGLVLDLEVDGLGREAVLSDDAVDLMTLTRNLQKVTTVWKLLGFAVLH